MNDTQKTRQSVEKGVNNLKEKGQDFFETAQQRAEDWADDAQSYGKGAWGDAKAWVRRNPGPALGCALAAGFLLTLIAARNMD